MFDEITRLGISYRWSNRFIYLSDEKAIKLSKDYGRAANNQKKEFMEQMADRALKEQVLNESSYAEELKEQAQNLADDTKKKIFANGYYTFNIVLMEEDQKLLKENVKLVMKTINDRGFQAVSETVNCFESFCGTIPGDAEYGARKPHITTYNLLSLIPITMDWDGDKINRHLKKEALLFCQSQENSSFKFNNHVGDVGHILVLGMTGSGKSVLLNTLAYQSRKYGSRIVFFDKGGSSRVLTRAVGGKFYNIGKDNISFQPLRYIHKESEKEWALEWLISILKLERVLTRAVGGKFYNIGKDNISFQPLRYIHKESEKEWALEWLISILKLENYNVTPKAKSLLTEALANLATTSEENRTMTSEKEWALEWLISILKLENYNVTPKAKSLLTEALANLATTSEENRTMTSLLLLLQDKDLNNILKIYTKDEAEGIYGKYFDNEEDDIKNDNLWQVFEMENIFDSNMLYPMLTYLFRRIETELFPSENTPMEKMTPTYLILDECWLFLDNTMFSGKIKDWLKTLRKKNVSVIMATQSLSDIENSKIKAALERKMYQLLWQHNHYLT